LSGINKFCYKNKQKPSKICPIRNLKPETPEQLIKLKYSAFYIKDFVTTILILGMWPDTFKAFSKVIADQYRVINKCFAGGQTFFCTIRYIGDISEADLYM